MRTEAGNARTVRPQKSPRRFGALLTKFAPVLLVAGLVLLHAAINWQWLAHNVTFTGADKAEHLARSMRYHQMLSPLTLRSLFSTIVAHAVRPSLFHISATLAYRILGFSVDAGPMINLFYMAILLSATYGLGAKLAGRMVGLLGTALVGTLPMIYAMSRYFYLEFALTAMVVATIYFLVASEGFKDRKNSILFGLSLGFSLLTKRTCIAFVLVPAVYVVLCSKLLPTLWRRLTSRPRIHWRALLVAVIVGGLLASIWFFPNIEKIAELVLGNWLFPLWWLLAALTIYLIVLPSEPETNLLAALSLGASVASVWYLARIEFFVRATGFAYGYGGSEERTFAWLDPSTYYYYLRRILIEHMSPFYVAFALLAGCVLLYFWLGKRRKPGMAWWVLVWWVIGSYVLMTFTLYRQSRAILPILPPIALLTAAGLLKLPWRRLRSALVAFMLVGGLFQLAALSFTPLRVAAEAPAWGTVRLFAQGGSIQWPDYGPNDSGWAIHNDLLHRLESVRQAQGFKVLRLGLLANTSNFNGPQFQPLILTSCPNIVVESLTRSTRKGEPAYPLLFDYDFLAVKRNNRFILDTEQATIDRLLDDPPLVFTQVFELDETYALPDGDALLLYKRRDFAPANLDSVYVSDSVAYLAANSRSRDAIILDTAAMLAPIARQLGEGPDYYLWPLTDDDLARIASQHPRIFAVGWESAASDYAWLDLNAHRAGSQWSGDIRLLIYGPTADLVESVSGAQFGQALILDRYALPGDPLSPGKVLPLRLTWRAAKVPDQRYKIFAHLLAMDGQLVAQYDGEPVGGLRPTTEWVVGEIVDDRRGVLLPMDLPTGTYTLIVGWYSMEGGTRLSAISADGEPLGAQLELGTLQVVDR